MCGRPTYFTQDCRTSSVHFLDGGSYIDKVKAAKTFQEAREAIPITNETDRVYTNTDLQKPVVVAQKGVPKYAVRRVNLNDVVVWNPWAGKANQMADFAPKDGWKHMSQSQFQNGLPRTPTYHWQRGC